MEKYNVAYDPNEILPKDTILIPEYEALRYVIAEQKEEILRKDAEIKTSYERGFSDGHKCCVDQIKKLEKQLQQVEINKGRTIQDDIDAGVYSDWSRQK